MKIIGITGGVGSGKSRVLSFMEERFHAVICQADHVAWELQKPGEKCYQEIVAHFGKKILNEDGTIDRKVLGQIVFGDEKELSELNAITHPAVKEAIQTSIVKEKNNGTELFVLEAALLIEEHYDEICDELWYIYTREKIREERLIKSRGYSPEKVRQIFASQLKDEIYRSHCSVIIDNNGSVDDAYRQIDMALKNIMNE